MKCYHIALKCFANKKNKNTILTSPISFVSTSNVILHNNLKPKFVDINVDTLNIDPKALKQELSINNKIKAIIPVHLGGYPGESVKIYRACKKKKFQLLRMRRIHLEQNTTKTITLEIVNILI